MQTQTLPFGTLDPSVSAPRHLPLKPYHDSKHIVQVDLTKDYASQQLSVPSSPEYQPSTACCSPGCESPIMQDALFENLNKLASQYLDPIAINESRLPHHHPFYIEPADRVPVGSRHQALNLPYNIKNERNSVDQSKSRFEAGKCSDIEIN